MTNFKIDWCPYYQIITLTYALDSRQTSVSYHLTDLYMIYFLIFNNIYILQTVFVRLSVPYTCHSYEACFCGAVWNFTRLRWQTIHRRHVDNSSPSYNHDKQARNYSVNISKVDVS